MHAYARHDDVGQESQLEASWDLAVGTWPLPQRPRSQLTASTDVKPVDSHLLAVGSVGLVGLDHLVLSGQALPLRHSSSNGTGPCSTIDGHMFLMKKRLVVISSIQCKT